MSSCCGCHAVSALSTIAHDFVDRFHRHTFLTDVMVSACGYLIGSLISQHYGFYSGLLDATTSADVAAFFATHAAPEYELFCGTSTDRLGVIYRFPNLAPNLTPSVAFETDYYRAPGTVGTHSLLTALEADVSIEGSLRTLRQCFQMRTCPEVAQRRYDLLKFPRGAISRSRIGRQKAVVVIPDEIRTSVPTYTSHPATGMPIITSNSTWECQQSIEDLHYRSKVQCFYFQHSRIDPVPQLNAAYLWPNEGDYFLLMIAYLFASGLGAYVYPSVILPQRLDLIEPGHGYVPPKKLAESAKEYISQCDESALSESIAPLFPGNGKFLFYIYKAGVLSYRGHVMGDGVAIEEALRHCLVARAFDRTSVTLIALEMILNEAMGRHSNLPALRDEALEVIVKDGHSPSKAFQFFQMNYLYALYLKRFSRDFAFYFYSLYQSG